MKWSLNRVWLVGSYVGVVSLVVLSTAVGAGVAPAATKSAPGQAFLGVAADRAFVAHPDGTVAALALEQGTALWQTHLTDPISEVQVDGQLLYVATLSATTFTLHCFDTQTFQSRWSMGFAPVFDWKAARGRVFLVPSNREGLCYDGATARMLWQTSYGDDLYSLLPLPGNRIAFGGREACTCPHKMGNIYCLDADTDKIVWQRGIPYENAPQLSWLSHTKQLCAVSADAVRLVDGTSGAITNTQRLPGAWAHAVSTSAADWLLMGTDQHTKVIDAATFAEVRKLRPTAELTSAPLVVNDTVIIPFAGSTARDLKLPEPKPGVIGMEGHGLYAFAPPTWDLKWEFPTALIAEPKVVASTSALYCVYPTTKGGTVASVDLEHGKPLWSTPCAAPVQFALGHDRVLVLGSDQSLAAFDPQSGKQLWSVTTQQ